MGKGNIRRVVPIVAAIVSVFVIVAAVFIYKIFYAKNFPGDESRAKVVTIPGGATFTQITDILYEQGVIESRTYFFIAGKALGMEEKLQRGMFEIPSGQSNHELLNALRQGLLRKVFDVTIFEGLNNRQIAGILARRMEIDSTKFVNLTFDSTFAASLGIDTGSLKGYLLPDRYRFFGDDTEEEIIRRLVREFWDFYDDSLRLKTQELGMSIYEVIVMASIVEGETLLDDEKPRVAGLYYNRLRRNMRLQADATVQYALVDETPRRLFNRDLRVQSSYNTYLFRGLPPGPINNPGRSAILASLYPEEHGYLYMVTDGTGGHMFSVSYNDHLRAVRQFRQYRRQLELQRQAETQQHSAN